MSSAYSTANILRGKGTAKHLFSDSTGFSLLEMVVVLAIIGILIAIQLPNIIGNTDKAKLIAAMSRISAAISECTAAKTNGAAESELAMTNPQFADLVPSMFTPVEGYRWDVGENKTGGCSTLVLIPVDSKGNDNFGKGYPALMANMAAGGRIVKAVIACSPYYSLNFVQECKRWDPTLTSDNTTGRDLNKEGWPVKDTSGQN